MRLRKRSCRPFQTSLSDKLFDRCFVGPNSAPAQGPITAPESSRGLETSARPAADGGARAEPGTWERERPRGRGRGKAKAQKEQVPGSPAAESSGPFHDEGSDLVSSSSSENGPHNKQPKSGKQKAQAKAVKDNDELKQLDAKMTPHTKQPLQGESAALSRQEEDEMLFATLMQKQADKEAKLAIKILNKELFGEA